MRAVLGIDTSCYTTSCALVTPEGEILSSSRRLLTVEDGARGLMQSQGLFQHVKNLPQNAQESMKAKLTEEEAQAVRRWEKSRYGQLTVVVVRKLPFAILISVGFLLFVCIRNGGYAG